MFGDNAAAVSSSAKFDAKLGKRHITLSFLHHVRGAVWSKMIGFCQKAGEHDQSDMLSKHCWDHTNVWQLMQSRLFWQGDSNKGKQRKGMHVGGMKGHNDVCIRATSHICCMGVCTQHDGWVHDNEGIACKHQSIYDPRQTTARFHQNWHGESLQWATIRRQTTSRLPKPTDN
jgi:hypothetical protein